MHTALIRLAADLFSIVTFVEKSVHAFFNALCFVWKVKKLSLKFLFFTILCKNSLKPFCLAFLPKCPYTLFSCASCLCFFFFLFSALSPMFNMHSAHLEIPFALFLQWR